MMDVFQGETDVLLIEKSPEMGKEAVGQRETLGGCKLSIALSCLPVVNNKQKHGK